MRSLIIELQSLQLESQGVDRTRCQRDAGESRFETGGSARSGCGASGIGGVIAYGRQLSTNAVTGWVALYTVLQVVHKRIVLADVRPIPLVFKRVEKEPDAATHHELRCDL